MRGARNPRHVAEVRAICVKTYQHYVKTEPMPEELRRSLRAHERVPVFMDRLALDLAGTTAKLSRERIEAATRDMCGLFVQAVKQAALERTASPLQVALAKAQRARVAEMKKLSDALDASEVEHVEKTKEGFETHRGHSEIRDDGPFV